VCAAAIARVNGDDARVTDLPQQGRRVGRDVQRWTATTNGPYSDDPYYLRVTKDQGPDGPTKYAIGDSGPSTSTSAASWTRASSSWSGSAIKRPDRPGDPQHRSRSSTRACGPGGFWHRYDFDGYGERRDGRSWRLFDDDTRRTLGRAVADLRRRARRVRAARRSAGRSALLQDMAQTANGGGMLPEQVWDGVRRPAKTGFKQGEGTFSATPLAWTHAQLVRLAWSAEAGAPGRAPAGRGRSYLNRTR
jgi:glucoamylase